eukprot:CAMPEP_0115137602 /NCGR_PEP_ID=MMETSP0227-20121206/57154_1 /TAXON_ID=89957 /ORGANISM="Polarella glacialis, Strain CCMP 1383" /LENGTH=49 /DNA_ID= /DNA_START= /DNA_END= /DNA_ORIENTATION=
MSSAPHEIQQLQRLRICPEHCAPPAQREEEGVLELGIRTKSILCRTCGA